MIHSIKFLVLGLCLTIVILFSNSCGDTVKPTDPLSTNPVDYTWGKGSTYTYLYKAVKRDTTGRDTVLYEFTRVFSTDTNTVMLYNGKPSLKLVSRSVYPSTLDSGVFNIYAGNDALLLYDSPSDTTPSVMISAPIVKERTFLSRLNSIKTDTLQYESLDEQCVTPAGTFRTIVVVKKQGSNTSRTFTSKQWFSPGVGFVKNEDMEVLTYKTGKKDIITQTLLLQSYTRK
ncbi:MAG: hypothetical protein JNL32_12695 [Candidatus Kapabacteria bacterium]|nr:hypothetical protein [Candidatus Kapabacteria bacterium]